MTATPTQEKTAVWTTMPSPVGELRIVARQVPGRPAGTVAITAIEFEEHTTGPLKGTSWRPAGERSDDHPVLAAARRQLEEYFARARTTFDLPLAPDGTEFQLKVWEQLRGIEYGATASYGDIAKRLGKTPAASRAVGLANGSNPIPIVVPCHRVIGADGSLTGYAGGLERKQLLLDLEQDALF